MRETCHLYRIRVERQHSGILQSDLTTTDAPAMEAWIDSYYPEFHAPAMRS